MRSGDVGFTGLLFFAVLKEAKFDNRQHFRSMITLSLLIAR